MKEYPDWHFRIIGDDGPGPKNNNPMRTWMKNHLVEVESRVEFMDGLAYDKLPAAISDCDIVLLPSLFESFSYTCAEAMAAGKAIVGSNNAGMADLIENNESGILVDPYKYKEMIKAVQRLISDNELRYAISINARKSILRKQDASQTKILFEEYYSNIIKKKFVKN